MICPKCGTENPDYFVYCKHCSELLPSDEPTPQQRVAAKVDAYSGYDPYSGVSIEKLLNEPYYDPRQRHNAIDPWELLDGEDEPEGSGRFSERLDEILPPEREYRRRSRRVPLDPDSVITHTPRSARSAQGAAGRPVVKGRAAAIGRESAAPQKTENEEPREAAYASAGKEEPPRAAGPESRAASQYDRYDDEDRPFAPSPKHAGDPVPSSPLNAMQFDEEPVSGPADGAGEGSPLSPRGLGDRPDGGERPGADPLQESAGRIRAEKNAEAVLDDIFDEDDAPYEEKRPRKAKKERAHESRKPRKAEKALVDEEGEPKKSRSGMIFWIVIAVLAAALLFVSFKIVTQNYGSIGAAFSAWFGGGDENAPNSDSSVVVEATDHSGMEAHSITVYGADGLTVVFADPTTGAELKQAVLQNGGYKLTIVDLNWIPEDAGDLTTFDVKPVIYLLDAEGNRTDLEVPGFTVNVPPTAVTVTAPDVSAPVSVESTAATLTITGTVEADTPTRLFWEGEEYTSAIDTATGAFTIEAPLTPGKTDYTLKAALTRHGDVSVAVTLESVVSELAVTIDQLPATVTEDAVPVSGKTEAGATVTVTGPGAGEVTVNGDGTFSFTADLANAGYGLAEFTVTAESGGRKDTADFSLLRTPEIDAYSRKAQVFDYKNVLRNPNDSKGKIFRLDATVQSSEKLSEYHQVVLVHVDGDSQKPVTLDYFSNTELSAGKSYRFFADANGNTEETDSAPKMPRMNAWFAGRNG